MTLSLISYTSLYKFVADVSSIRVYKGSYPFLDLKFRDFSRTFKDTFSVFQGLHAVQNQANIIPNQLLIVGSVPAGQVMSFSVMSVFDVFCLSSDL